MLLCGLLCVSRAHAATLHVDGRDVPTGHAVLIDGRDMVPLRSLFESLGATVQYDVLTGTLQIVRGNTVIDLTLGSRQAIVNGRLVMLDVPPQRRAGQVLLPLRFVCDALGAQVVWNPAARAAEVRRAAMIVYAPAADLPLPLHVQPVPASAAAAGAFHVRGITAPFAMITINATRVRPTAPGHLDVTTQFAKAFGQADAQGRFEVPFFLDPLPPDTLLQMHVSAADALGRTSSTMNFDIATAP
jgi:hypothetical protein